MSKALSVDLRDRVVVAIESGSRVTSKRPVTLSITHSLIPCDLGAELDVSQASEAAPDDRVARWRVRCPCEVSPKSGELRQIEN